MSSLLDDLNRKFVSRTPHMREIGARITAVERARGSMTLPARPQWLGDPVRGLLHPGALTVLADSACGLAVGAALTRRAPYATLDLRMDYLRPAGPGLDVHCDAHCYRLTRNVAFVRAEVWQVERDQPIAAAQASFMLSTPAGSRQPQQATPDAASKAAPDAAPAPAQDAEAGIWTPPAASEPVLPGSPIPYVEYLGIRVAPAGEQPIFRLPFHEKLIGNPHLPALHGGVVAGFAETAATLHLIRTLQGAKFPKSIDFSIDYLRAGRPEETFAACEVVRVGARVALVQVRCWQKSPDRPIAVARAHFLLTTPDADAGPAGPPAAPAEPAVLHGDGIRAYRNPHAAAPAQPYGAQRASILSDAGFTRAAQEITHWPGYAVTPLHDLPGLAARLGIGALHYKDERARFGLKSFKALGGAYAVFRLLERAIEAHNGGQRVSSQQVIDGAWRDLVSRITVTCATDGNHGRSVAWGARLFGCRCVIYIHQTVSEARRSAIEQFGAEVVRVPGNYDDSVRHAAAEALRNGWTVVSDTSYEGYRDIPVDVMHGYGVMSREIIAQLEQPPTHVFVQAGVGALAASVCAAFWIEWGERRPAVVIVEPSRADCHFRSGLAGRPVAVTGDLDTVMAGLACGEVSPLAWEIVSAAANAFVAVDDRYALQGMRVFAAPAAGDPPIVSGETGASGLAALLAAQGDDALWRLFGLNAGSRVLLIGSEGDTDSQIYRQVVGKDAHEVLA